jgi:hypothetical protein
MAIRIAGPAVPRGTRWSGSTIEPANHWRRNTTLVCPHRHRTRVAALRCSIALERKA